MSGALKFAASSVYSEIEATERADRIERHDRLAAELVTLRETAETELQRLEPIRARTEAAAAKSLKSHTKALVAAAAARAAVTDVEYQTRYRISQLERQLEVLADSRIVGARKRMDARAYTMHHAPARVVDCPDESVVPYRPQTKSNLHAPRPIMKAVCAARVSFDRLKHESSEDLNRKIRAIERTIPWELLNELRIDGQQPA